MISFGARCSCWCASLCPPCTGSQLRGHGAQLLHAVTPQCQLHWVVRTSTRSCAGSHSGDMARRSLPRRKGPSVLAPLDRAQVHALLHQLPQRRHGAPHPTKAEAAPQCWLHWIVRRVTPSCTSSHSGDMARRRLPRRKGPSVLAPLDRAQVHALLHQLPQRRHGAPQATKAEGPLSAGSTGSCAGPRPPAPAPTAATWRAAASRAPR